MSDIVHFMKSTVAPLLLPILRSRGQAEMLCAILSNPQREWTLAELAKVSRQSLPTVQREVQRAEIAELVKSRRVGRSRLVSGGMSPMQHHLGQLLMMSFGPRQVIAKEFGSLPGVEKLFIFGSWAARFEGDRGFPPNDIDVLIIGNPDVSEVAEVSQKSSKMLSIDVNPTIESHTWWANKSGTGFRKQIASRPLVELEVLGVSSVDKKSSRSHKRRSS